MVSQVHAVPAHPLVHFLPAERADGVDVMERLLCRLKIKKLRRDAVHVPRAEAAPEGNDERAAVVHAELFLGLRLRLREEVAAHRRTGDDHAVLVLIIPPAVLKADKNAVAMVLEQSGRQPRNGVRLVHRRRNAARVAVAHDGIARVAARTDNEVGLKFIENGVRLTLRVHQIAHGDEVMAQLLRPKGAVEGRDVDRAERIGRVRDQVALQSALRADEEDAGLRVSLPQEACERQRGVDVSRRAAAGENNVHAFRPPFFLAAVCFPPRHIFELFSLAASAAKHSAPRPFPRAGWRAPCRRS